MSRLHLFNNLSIFLPSILPRHTQAYTDRCGGKYAALIFIQFNFRWRFDNSNGSVTSLPFKTYFNCNVGKSNPNNLRCFYADIVMKCSLICRAFFFELSL